MPEDILDTPLTRLKATYDSKLVARDDTITELRQQVEATRTQQALTTGVNQMLKLLLADMAAGVDLMARQIAGMAANIAELRQKLPNLE
jgi:hypothetical protein